MRWLSSDSFASMAAIQVSDQERAQGVPRVVVCSCMTEIPPIKEARGVAVFGVERV